jgi:hypothetical protein
MKSDIISNLNDHLRQVRGDVQAEISSFPGHKSKRIYLSYFKLNEHAVSPLRASTHKTHQNTIASFNSTNPTSFKNLAH